MDINLADPGLYAAPGGGLEELRYLQREQPVYWNALPQGGFWALTRYADAVMIYRNPKSFTSRHGIQVGQLGGTNLPAAGKMLVLADTGAHRRIKAIMSRHLTPVALQRLVPEMRTAARQAIELHTEHEQFDFVTGVAGQLTLTVIGGLLGVPSEDREMVSQWVSAAFEEPPAADASPRSDSAQANAHLFAYFGDLLAARRRQTQGHDLLSALARTVADDTEPLSDEEILFNIHLVLAGGQETTRQAIVGSAMAFAEHPDQWRRLRCDGTLLQTAVEEIIRWSAPSLNVMRTATRDIMIGATRVRAGDQVTMWNPILNRDDAAFPDAATFDVARDPNRHLSFGMGSHFCLGAWLARQELQVLLEEMRPRVRHLEPAGQPRRSRSSRTWGYDHFPVRFIT